MSVELCNQLGTNSRGRNNNFLVRPQHFGNARILTAPISIRSLSSPFLLIWNPLQISLAKKIFKYRVKHLIIITQCRDMEKASGSMLGVSLRGGEVFFWWYVRRVRCIFETEASEPGYYWCAGREAPGTPDPPNNRIYHNATHRPPTFTEKETLFCETKKIGLKCLQLHPCNTIWMRVIWWLWSC